MYGINPFLILILSRCRRFSSVLLTNGLSHRNMNRYFVVNSVLHICDIYFDFNQWLISEPSTYWAYKSFIGYKLHWHCVIFYTLYVFYLTQFLSFCAFYLTTFLMCKMLYQRTVLSSWTYCGKKACTTCVCSDMRVLLVILKCFSPLNSHNFNVCSLLYWIFSFIKTFFF